MKGKGIISFSLWIVVFFPLLEAPVTLNEECPTILFHSGTIEPGHVFPEQFSHQSKNFNLLSMNQLAQNETQPNGKSLNVMITNLQYTQDIYINENQIITVWSQNTSSQPRDIYHKISGIYPDGSPFLIEGYPVEIPPGWTLCDSWAVSNAGKGIGFFNFICQAWEEVNPSTKIIHDEESGCYWAKFYRPSGVDTGDYLMRWGKNWESNINILNWAQRTETNQNLNIGITKESPGVAMERKITFSEKTEKDIKMIVDEFGFDSEEEFVEEAVAEKILELKKQMFFNISDQIGAT